MNQECNIPMAECHIFCNEDKSEWRIADALTSEYRDFDSLSELISWLDSELENAKVEA